MAQERITSDNQLSAERRCPNCGTRVARDAETCFMCGHDLRIQPPRRRRISWIDTLLVVAVAAVFVFWWQISADPGGNANESVDAGGIAPGDVPILAPTATPTATPIPTATATPVVAEQVFVTHVIESGETLLTIAGLYDVTVDDIRQANNLTNDLINIDQELIIPILRTPDDPAAPAAISSEFSYTVKEGDTIVSIATLFGSTVDDILAANGLAANDLIRPGDLLVIPVRTVPDEVKESSTESGAAPSSIQVSAGAPTENSNTIYIEPRLIGPPNRAAISREEAVLLRWISVDVLAPNEWYVLLIYPTDGAAQPISSIWTRATSHRLGTEFAPPERESATYAWQVSVVRVTSGAADGYMLEAASPPSLVRTFTWE